jgi:hypothetical protein
MKDLLKEHWAAHLGSSFELDAGELGVLPLELVEVTGMGVKPGAAREPYSLVFRGPAEPVLAQQIWHLNHPRVGEQDVFLVPIGPDSQGMCYEAVFT